MLIEVLIAGAILGAVGFLLGAALWFASKKFHVEKDDRIEKITACFPGANCGGCGYAGCSNYAEAIVHKGAPVTLCGGIGKEEAKIISDVLGIEPVYIEKKTAFVKCYGGLDISDRKYKYQGLDDCVAASRLHDGPMDCKYGCVGLGNCVKVCPTGAISVVLGVALVDKNTCIGCGVCAKACPKNIIDIVTVPVKAFVACSSHDKAAVTKKHCSLGCLGCKVCEKTCKYGAIKVIDNVAVVDNSLCTVCGACVEKCPIHIIEIN